jgi:hypothetical protein
MSAISEVVIRKRCELQAKLSGVSLEFEYWLSESERGKEFEKHNSQISRILKPLQLMQKQLEGEMSKVAGDAEAVLTQCRDIERRILVVYRIWEFFRTKFLLRRSDLFKNYLAFCDELAWNCYRLAANAARAGERARLKEPPLVFLSGMSTPFASSRNTPFEAEFVQDEDIDDDLFIGFLKELPVPVISVPWFQMRHLPDALIIAHEVGHNVEDDLGLTTDLRNAVKGSVSPNRWPAWEAWLGEVFADFFGTLALGPAFVGTLMDFLASDANKVCTEEREVGNWGDYPTDYLRVMLCLAALEKLQFNASFTSLAAQWKATYPRHAMNHFDSDIKSVVTALWDAKLPQIQNKTLPAVMRLKDGEHQNAVQEAEGFVRGYNPQNSDVRVFAAACRLAFEKKPEVLHQAAIQENLLEYFVNRIPRGVRAVRTETDANEVKEYEDSLTNQLSSLLSEPKFRN